VGEPELRAFFLAKVAAPGALAEDATLGAELAARMAAGREAWPALAMTDEQVMGHLASHAGAGLPPLKHAGDFWLACACALGVPGAAAAFEKEHRQTIDRAAERVSRPLKEDIAQQVMVALFVAEPGARPRIAEYGGRAALRTWLTTVTSNAALNRVQRKDEQSHDSVGELGHAVAALEPELAFAKARYGAELDEALREAMGALDERKRVLLRLHHVQGWTMDRLATMYKVSRSGAGRLVIEARQALLDDAKARLNAKLGLTPSELESLVAVLHSNLQVSLVRMLGDDEK
jgi:RNA polymerase sigma-70 factor (ECF subfamily)